IRMEGGTTFLFVTDGFDAAYSAACEAAGDDGGDIAGGASTVRQALIAGVIDELTLDIAPVLLGSGERIFDGVESFGFEPAAVLHSPLTTHIRYRRVSWLPAPGLSPTGRPVGPSPRAPRAARPATARRSTP